MSRHDELLELLAAVDPIPGDQRFPAGLVDHAAVRARVFAERPGGAAWGDVPLARRGFLVAAAVFLAALAVGGVVWLTRSPDPAPVVDLPTTTTTTVITTTTAGTTTTTTAPPDAAPVTTTPTTIGGAGQPPWPVENAAAMVEHQLAALAAGAYEQAGWRYDNEGTVYDGQGASQTAVEYLGEACRDGRCAGPYDISFPDGGQIEGGAWVFEVVHRPTGEAAEMSVGAFEGQLVVMGLPPLVASDAAPPSLVEVLFGGPPTVDVVVSRYDAFEIWEDGGVRWVTNWWAGAVDLDIESGHLAAGGIVAPLDDPTATQSFGCPTLLDRDGTLLVLDRCAADGERLVDLATGNVVDPPDVIESVAARRDTDEVVAWSERGGTTVGYLVDAHGNLAAAINDTGTSIIGEDYPGRVALSTDGRILVYGDQRAQPSPAFSPVVVARDVALGIEVGRWTLDDGFAGCIEASADWIVACVIDATSTNGPSHAVAAVVIDLTTGELRTVPTRARIYMPVPASG